MREIENRTGKNSGQKGEGERERSNMASLSETEKLLTTMKFFMRKDEISLKIHRAMDHH